MTITSEAPAQNYRAAVRLRPENAYYRSVPLDRLLALGAEDYEGGQPGIFNMAVMGLRLAQRANGVSQLHGRVSRLTALVALGTHKAMTEEALGAMLGFEPGQLEQTYPGLRLLNHEWWDPSTFVDLGTIPAARIEQLSEGRLSLDVPVLLNREIVEHDVAIVVGPVLPHEVVGISGGNKVAIHTVRNQLRNTAHRRSDHRHSNRHGLQQTDGQALIK